MKTAIDTCYYITGIVVHYTHSSRSRKKGWSAVLYWQDAKFSETGSVKGEIRTNSIEENLSEAVDSILEAAKHFNVNNNEELNIPIGLYYEGDGKDAKYPPIDGEWNYTMNIIKREAEKRGWESY